jgi:type IV secretion system protein VirD4
MARQTVRDEAFYLGLTDDKHATPVHYLVANDKGDVKPGDRNSIIFGPPGSGKDTGLIIPNMALLKRSVFVIDPKGEVAAVTARARAKFSRVVMFNPYGLLVDTHPHLRSHGFNPLLRKDFNPTSINFANIAKSIADALIKVDGSEPFFAIGGKDLVAGLIMWERTKNGDKASLVNVRRELTSPYSVENGEAIGLLRTLLDIREHGDPRIIEFTDRYTKDSKASNDVVATVIGQTSFLSIAQLSADLRHGASDFDQMKRELVTVYCILPATELEKAACWLRLLVGMALDDLLRSGPGPHARPLLILNEVGQLGYLHALANAMGISRGFGFDIMTVWQSLSQIKSIYKEEFERFIAARGLLASYAPQDMGTAEYLSKLLGKHTARINTINSKPGQAQTDLHDAQLGFPVYHPEDLTRMPPRTLLNYMEGVKYPFHTHAPGYWELPCGRDLDPNPYHVTRDTKPQPPQPSAPQGNRPNALDELKRRRGKL